MRVTREGTTRPSEERGATLNLSGRCTTSPMGRRASVRDIDPPLVAIAANRLLRPMRQSVGNALPLNKKRHALDLTRRLRMLPLLDFV
jgi:hypothetical protein